MTRGVNGRRRHGRRRRHFLRSAGAPGWTMPASSIASELVRRMQPCDSAWPMRDGFGGSPGWRGDHLIGRNGFAKNGAIVGVDGTAGKVLPIEKNLRAKHAQSLRVRAEVGTSVQGQRQTRSRGVRQMTKSRGGGTKLASVVNGEHAMYGNRRVCTVVLISAFGLSASAQPAKLSAGTEITVQTDEAVDAKSPTENRIYSSVVEADVVDAGGRVLIPRGSRAELILRDSLPSSIVLDLESVTIRGQRYVTETIPSSASADRSEKEGTPVGERPGNYVGHSLLATVVSTAPPGSTSVVGAADRRKDVASGSSVKLPEKTIIQFRLERAMVPGGADPGYTKEGHHYHRYDRDDRDR